MRKKKMMIAMVLGIVLLGTVHAAYSYWTDQIQVREEVALVWPNEVEIEEESEATSEEAESVEEKVRGG